MECGLQDRTVVVTGGASNIGRAIARRFAEEKARVVIFDRDLAQAERTAGEIAGSGGTATVYEVDVTDVAATKEAASAVERDVGPISVLVNNVGWNDNVAFFLDLPPERWDRIYRLNLFATLNATHAVLPFMRERREGNIVSIASDAAFGEFRTSDYGAMKAGVIAFSRTIAKEYGRDGIRSNVVAPGLVIPPPEEIGEGSNWHLNLDFSEKAIRNIESGIPLRKRPQADDIAWSVVFLASERARMLTGQLLSVSGGFIMPR